MKSPVIIKRSIVVGGHKTSVSLEDAFWNSLKNIAHAHDTTLSELINKIDSTREQSNLSSALRQFVLHHFRNLFVLHKLGAPMKAEQTHLSPADAESTPASSS
jgi:predicted DNA-binding ribbon-helix-helix protein